MFLWLKEVIFRASMLTAIHKIGFGIGVITKSLQYEPLSLAVPHFQGIDKRIRMAQTNGVHTLLNE